jgi:diaminopimelate decarboxylase
VDLASILPVSTELRDGEISVGGCPLHYVAAEYGTPVYVYDRATLLDAFAEARDAFHPFGARISYASKACEVDAVLRVFCELGTGLDCVSLGELRAGLRAGFSPNRIHLHGNAKSDEELEAAVRAGLHAVVIDNFVELKRLSAVAHRLGTVVRVMLRLALPIEARTHPHLMTSGRYSKFGMNDEEEALALGMLAVSEHVRLAGLHVHLGSQIDDVSLYPLAAEALLARGLRLRAAGQDVEELSIGGGWSVPYVPGDPRLSALDVASALTAVWRPELGFTLAVEPGRALVARSGVALYSVLSVKESDRGRIVAVDGGMGDNPRPALYGSRYSAFMVDAISAPSAGPVDVVGRYCESGDVLVRNVELPPVGIGDVIGIPVSGAYQLSMASSYNLVPPPAVAMVADGEMWLVRRRPSIDDLLTLDVLPER